MTHWSLEATRVSRRQNIAFAFLFEPMRLSKVRLALLGHTDFSQAASAARDVSVIFLEPSVLESLLL
jgi:hypothetical protein